MLEELAGAGVGAGAAPSLARTRAVHRAIAELRRGVPVVLEGAAPLVLWAAETVGAAGLAEGAALCAGAPVLLLAPSRAAALVASEAVGDVAAFATDGLLTPEVLQGLADPLARQILPERLRPAAVPALGAHALRLLKFARLLPAAVAAPAVADAGARAEALGLLRVAAEAVDRFPATSARSLRLVAEARVPLQSAPDARLVAFRGEDGGVEHIAIVIGEPDAASAAGPAPLVRVHSECFTGDLLGSLRCDCGQQLASALHRIGREGVGAVLYLAQEGRGIGLPSKLRAYALQDGGLDTVDANRALGWHAEERDFQIAAAMLARLGIGRIRLLTNNPAKLAALAACGIEVTQRLPLVAEPNGVDDFYLATKARRFGHLL